MINFLWGLLTGLAIGRIMYLLIDYREMLKANKLWDEMKDDESWIEWKRVWHEDE